MKLVFYSGGTSEENLLLDTHLLNLCQDKQKKLQYCFIPSSSYMADQEFGDVIDHYRPLGIKKFLKIELDYPLNNVLLKSLFSSDIIHFGGGNTFYFLKQLKKSNLIKQLKEWLDGGGILSGLSAGAILMTHSIHTASFPEFDRDENEDNLTKLRGMNLVKFEFFPHYRNSNRYDNELRKYSQQVDRPVYASVDGAGIVVDKDCLTFVGKVACFHQGKKFFIHK